MPTDDEGADHREPERRAPLVGDGRGIGTQHHQLAMGEVDDVHHAEDDDQPERAEQEERGVGAELVEHARDDGELIHRAFLPEPIAP